MKFAILIFMLSSSSFASSETAQIPPLVKYALKLWNKNFKPWKKSDYAISVQQLYKSTKNQNLSYVIGDFNNDGKTDAVIMGSDGKFDYTLIVLSLREGGYDIQEFKKKPHQNPKIVFSETPNGKLYGLQTYLFYVKPKILSSVYESRTMDLKSDAFEQVTLPKASSIYYYLHGKWAIFTTGE